MYRKDETVRPGREQHWLAREERGSPHTAALVRVAEHRDEATVLEVPVSGSWCLHVRVAVCAWTRGEAVRTLRKEIRWLLELYREVTSCTHHTAISPAEFALAMVAGEDPSVRKLRERTSPPACSKVMRVRSSRRLWSLILPLDRPTATTSTAGLCLQRGQKVSDSDN